MRYTSVMRRRPFAFLAAALAVLIPQIVRAAEAGHGPDVRPVLLGLVLILTLGKLGGALFDALKLPAVLGELMAGIVLGNVGLIGVHGLDALRADPAIAVLAQLGVLFLLFQVGLESDVGRMAQVGASSLVVAVLGVVAPMVLGFWVTRWFFPTHASLGNWFVGATLCATSVGITARVLGDLGRTASAEGRIILGAAVIDDVLGLMVLAVVQGLIEATDRGVGFHASTVLWIVGRAVLFLGAALIIGRGLSGRVFRVASYLPGSGLLLTTALAFCFLLAWLAGMVGLAPIVGAFAAGLVLDEVHYRALRERERHQHDVEELMQPLATFLVPVFFVLMGMGVDLRVFARGDILAFAGVLTVVAIAGKQACSLGVLTPGADRLAIGLGMIPRGEVGLIFAGIGATLTIGGQRVIDDAIYSAVIVMVALTTLITPPLLVWRMRPRKA
jgi:Kef-type K+ transport system membrane component KefB